MPIHTSPDDPQPTHDIVLTDRQNRSVGLIMCDARGRRKPAYNRTPIERTALKTTTGNSQYSDLDYPYAPIVQDDWSGGRGNLDFERDTTKFRDALTMRTSRPNKAFLGPQEQFTSGGRGQAQRVPGNVQWVALSNGVTPGTVYTLEHRFKSPMSYTVGQAGLKVRRRGLTGALRIELFADSGGAKGATISYIDVLSSRLPDILNEWLAETFSAVLVADTFYWLTVRTLTTAPIDTDNHWEIACSPGPGSTYWADNSYVQTLATYQMYFRLTDADTYYQAFPFNYKEQEYVFLQPFSGSLKLLENGDRGAADSNAGALNQLKDATKTWPVNQWAGCMVKVTDGAGKWETPRRILSNTDKALVVTPAWSTTQDTTTEYVILGADQWHEIAGHGATIVTNLLITTKDVLYVCQGDLINIERLRAYNDAGLWRHFDDALCHAAEGNAASKAYYLCMASQNTKIVLGTNKDANGNVSISVMSNASVPDWGTDLTWAPPIAVGTRYRPMNGIETYVDDAGNEAVWIGKVDRPWIWAQSGVPYPLNLSEMEAVMAPENFKCSLVHNVYLYFSLGNGFERYYRGQLDDLGPNLGEGFPENRRGNVNEAVGYPGRIFLAIDAGPTGYSSLVMRDANGYHEHYRAPLGKRITGLQFQPIPGSNPDRLWMMVGNDLIWLPFPSGDMNELIDPNYLYTNEGCLELSRMHDGMFDVQKIVRLIKLITDDLEDGVCWIEMDRRLDDASIWTPFAKFFKDSPEAILDLAKDYGMEAKRIQLRLRFYTADAHKTPVLLAVIVEAVMRVSVKYIRSLTFRLKDGDMGLDRNPDEMAVALEKMKILDDWASDNANSMIHMDAKHPLYHDCLVFLNPIAVNHVHYKSRANPAGFNVYVCTTSVQDA